MEVEFPQSDEVEVIVPTKCVNELTRLVSEAGEVKMMVGQNQIAFDVGGSRLVSKLVDGNYPNYRQVIPSEVSERVTLERVLFLSAVQRVSLLASEKSNSVKLMLTKNNLEIVAVTPDIGEARESIPLAYKGKDISIAFNPEYLMAPLRALPNDEVYLDLIDEMSPGVIKIQSPFLYVLMPMRIN
jgi:DNA polymerase-3 subunit beta